MQYKYLYIDDESNDTVKSYQDSLSNDNLTIDYKHIGDITKEYLINNLKNYDGILLDLRTDELPNDKGKTSEFTGAVWGQHIRDLVTLGQLEKDIPIVLFSTDQKLRDTYFRDMTSNNIFDRFLTKDNTPSNAIQKLIALAKGYQEIAQEKNFNKLLNIDISNLDSRIFSRFMESKNNIPTHEYAQMILKDLIYAKGVLINEKYLAARLGIDKDNSSDWEQVKEFFLETKYNGVFSDGWDRWWMFKVDEKFNEISSTYLSYLDAKERVAILKDKLKLENIVVPEPIENSQSYDYWVVCKALKRLLDPTEGFKVYTRTEPKPWQEYEYISLNALLNPDTLQEKDIKIHPADKERAIKILEKYNG